MIGQARLLRRIVARAVVGAVAILAISSFTTPPPYAKMGRAGPIPRSYFGMHFHRIPAGHGDSVETQWPAIGVGSWRLWDARVAWPDIEPSPGVWRFQRLDRCLAIAESLGIDVLVPLGLSPGWASARPAEPSAYTLGAASEPHRNGDWDAYVQTVCRRYSGKVKAYETWNEPNLRAFYSGNVDTMLHLATETWRTVKSVDSGALVVSPSPTESAGLRWLDQYLQRGGGKYADVIGYHFYVGQKGTPEDMARLVLQVRALLEKYDLAHVPLWNTETGWLIQSKRTGRTSALTSSVSTAYVARALILGWAMGLDRFYWYSWDHHEMGLVETDGKTLKPAGRAFGIVEGWLVGATMDGVDTTSTGCWRVHLSRPNGYEAIAAWSPRGEGWIELPTEWESTIKRTLDGAVVELSAARLRSRLTLDGSPILFEKGAARQ